MQLCSYGPSDHTFGSRLVNMEALRTLIHLKCHVKGKKIQRTDAQSCHISCVRTNKKLHCGKELLQTECI